MLLPDLMVKVRALPLLPKSSSSFQSMTIKRKTCRPEQFMIMIFCHQNYVAIKKAGEKNIREKRKEQDFHSPRRIRSSSSCVFARRHGRRRRRQLGAESDEPVSLLPLPPSCCNPYRRHTRVPTVQYRTTPVPESLFVLFVFQSKAFPSCVLRGGQPTNRSARCTRKIVVPDGR